MRHPRTILAIVGVTVALGISGIAVALSSGGSTAAVASSKAAAVPPVVGSQASASSATIHTESATVGGKAETILVDAKGLPLYTYKPDTATKSFVSDTRSRYDQRQFVGVDGAGHELQPLRLLRWPAPSGR